MTQRDVVLIAAVARNGAIGREGQLLFLDPVDQRHFRTSTMGGPVIMGRKTWESLPPKFRPLPGRQNIVLTRQPGFEAEGAEVAVSLTEALALAGNAPRVCVIGGAEIYAAALPLAHTLLLTEVEADLAGDAFFPPWRREDFREVARESHATAAGLPFHFVTYRRR